MSTGTSHSFFDKLVEKERQKMHQLNQSRDKENIHKQHIPISKSKKTKKIKTEVHSLLGDKKKEQNWYLDRRMLKENEFDDIKIIQNWLCFDNTIIRFKKIIDKAENQQEILKIVEQSGIINKQEEKQSIIIKIYSTFSSSLVEILLEFALPLLSLGKGTWSLAALTQNRRFDLLSLDVQGSILWKSKNALSKVQLEREQLMRRVFGFSAEKEKEIGQHEILAKLQLQNNNVMYFVLRDPKDGSTQNAELLIEQEIFIDSIGKPLSYAFLQPSYQIWANTDSFKEIFDKLGIKMRHEQQMERQERQLFLKTIIFQLQGELEGKQQQLKQYKSEQVLEGDFPIPSERIEMGQQRYMHLKRTIKETKIL